MGLLFGSYGTSQLYFTYETFIDRLEYAPTLARPLLGERFWPLLALNPPAMLLLAYSFAFMT